jgi:hypothetical protein
VLSSFYTQDANAAGGNKSTDTKALNEAMAKVSVGEK